MATAHKTLEHHILQTEVIKPFLPLNNFSLNFALSLFAPSKYIITHFQSLNFEDEPFRIRILPVAKMCEAFHLTLTQIYNFIVLIVLPHEST